MPEHRLRVLLTEEKIQSRIRGLGAEIAASYPDGTLCLIGVLKGSFLFLADLARVIARPVRFDFVGASSYGDGMVTRGDVRLTKDADGDLRGVDILVVEDIIDTGITLSYVLDHLRSKRPRSLRVVTLLDKPEKHEREIHIDYLGFTIPNEFVVGYGMDYAEDYRYLKDICVLDPNG